ncbi:WhiB family transcriptional regulator [Mycobacterium simiae]|uniref:Transcriptional regulator WhiB n=1 Tax=Mycobacterium simiae TaxID=1784 RepID=A0A5B1BJN5_MYCSI|nr:WhiB family transcriptional regulator [Mycobacterium simiae]
MLEAQPRPSDEQWYSQALCPQTDPEAFFPDKGGSTKDAKKICLRCRVKKECLQWALDHDERFGIWGGLSERERRRLKRGIDPDRSVDEIDQPHRIPGIAASVDDYDQDARLAG